MLMFHMPSIKGPQKEWTYSSAILVLKWVNEDLDDNEDMSLTHPGNPHKGREKLQSRAEEAEAFSATQKE